MTNRNIICYNLIKEDGRDGKKIKSKIGNQNMYEISYIYEL